MELSGYKNPNFSDGMSEGYSSKLNACIFWGMIDGSPRLRVRCLVSSESVEDLLGLELSDRQVLPSRVKDALWPKFQHLVNSGQVSEPQEEWASHVFDVVI